MLRFKVEHFIQTKWLLTSFWGNWGSAPGALKGRSRLGRAPCGHYSTLVLDTHLGLRRGRPENGPSTGLREAFFSDVEQLRAGPGRSRCAGAH